MLSNASTLQTNCCAQEQNISDLINLLASVITIMFKHFLLTICISYNCAEFNIYFVVVFFHLIFNNIILLVCTLHCFFKVKPEPKISFQISQFYPFGSAECFRPTQYAVNISTFTHSF